MKIPKTLKIAGFTWEVVRHKDVTHEGNCYGSTHHSTQKFFLEPGMTKQKEEQTLIHEILHALWNSSALVRSFEDPDNKKEEQVVHALSVGLYQVFKDNHLLK